MASGVVFNHGGFTVRASHSGDQWRGEILNQQGELHDVFAYTREAFPGAVIGALRCADIAFAPRLAARLWIHTDEHGLATQERSESR